MAEYAATIAGLISLGLTVCEGLTKYYSAAKSHVKDIKDIISQLRVLTNILQVLQSTVETSDFTLSPAFQLVLSNIENCRDGIKELEQHKALLQPLPTTVGVVKGSFQKAIYPFRKHQLESLKTTLDRLNSQLSLACHASHMQQLQFLTTLSEKTFSHITSATISAPTAQGPGSTQQTAKDVSFNDQKMQATYSTTHCACRARYINGNQWTSYYVSLWSFQQSRHHPSCPRYDSRSDVNNWGLRLVIPLLWTSGQQYMSIDVRVGRGSRPFTLICQRMVPMTNEAFALVDRWATERWRVKSAAVCCSELARARHGLRLALENGSIFPNDTLLDGSNLLHRTLKLVRYVSFFHVGDDDEEMYEQALALVRTVIRVGVPLDERDIFGESPIDNVIQCQYRNNQITTAARYSRDIEFRARLLSLFKDRCSASADVSDRSHVWELSLLKSETSVLEDFLGPGLEQAVLRTDIRALQSALQPLSTSDSEHRASILLAANIACESDWAQGLAVLFDHVIEVRQSQLHFLTASEKLANF
ncbi:hypothetical protein HII31_08023 [Pseudocercospora fuligena]|uniref:Fungal N-terminal domain-containing protein n=1 Tax=Pseudocercospora fuligena TaxID=685502 RepID=A0A8H6RH34_9PEZI|nr:hypothetical protein HII31_08023 [Pseudocercospora fuligena]